MAFDDYTLPLDDEEWKARNAAMPPDVVGDTAYQAFSNVGQPQPTQPPPFDAGVTPDMLGEAPGQQAPPPDPSAQLAQAPNVPDLATPQPQGAPPQGETIGGSANAPPQPENAAPPQAPGGPAVPETALPPLGPPPKPPVMTGDNAKDVQNNLEFHRQLTAYQSLVAQHAAATDEKKAQVAAAKSQRELEMEQNAATIRNDTKQRYAEELQRRQQSVNDAVAERTKRYEDLGKGNGFLDQSLGDMVLGAIIFAMGDKQATLRNVAAAQLGQSSNYQNEGLQTIRNIMQRRYQQKADRLKAASDSVLEARYGYKDAQENQRAALNDLDADMAANYRLASKEAAAELAKRGVGEQDIAANKMVADLAQAGNEYESKILEREEQTQQKREGAAATNKLAEAHLGLQERQAVALENQRHDTNVEHVREFNAQDAERRQRMAAAEEERKRKAKEDAEKATTGSVRQNAVLGNLAEAEKAVKDVGEVSADSINKLQTNTEQARATEHAATSGVIGNLGARVARGTGLAARGRYDGIPEAEQKKITAAEQVITHLTEMQQGKNIETLEQYRDRYSPYVPGLSEAEVRRREKALPGLVAEQRATQDPKGVGTKRIAGLTGGEGEAKVPGGKVGAAQRVLDDPNTSPTAKKNARKFLDNISNNGSSSFDDLGR